MGSPFGYVTASILAQQVELALENEDLEEIENENLCQIEEEDCEITEDRLSMCLKEKRASSMLTEQEKRKIVKGVVSHWVRGGFRVRRSSITDRAKGKVEIEYTPSGEKRLRENSFNSTFERRDSLSKSILSSCNEVNWCDTSFVRCPDLNKIALKRVTKLKKIVESKKFASYSYRFASAQVDRTLRHPTLPQPKGCDENNSEMVQTRDRHRFIIGADTQFGIIMDGLAMPDPNWDTEIEISRRAVKKINSMGKKPGEEHKRPLFVAMCGDLVDTEASFVNAMASWKKVMKDWERQLIYDQQNKDFKEVWSRLDKDIALVCMCGNHDVGNRPNAASIERYKQNYGDDYLAFWANGTYNIIVNNNLFADPSDAKELFDAHLAWLEERLIYATEKKANHIFVFGHYPWFLNHEDEEDEQITTNSLPPPGWGTTGAKFPDYYFTVPREYRKLALDLFKKYKVRACFSGHFHQNIITKSSWGMGMIVTGPLSMTLKSDGQSKLVEPHDVGLRIVDVKKNTYCHKFFELEGTWDENNLFCQLIKE